MNWFKEHLNKVIFGDENEAHDEAEMNWFKEHLNWTWLLAILVVGIVNRVIIENISEEAAIIAWIIGIIGVFLITLWFLKQKHRDWIYVFLLIVPLFGWVFILALENRSEVTDIVNGKVITRPRDKND